MRIMKRGWGLFFRQTFRDMLCGWRTWEYVWLLGAPAGIVILSLLLRDTLFSIAASVTGVLYVILAAKGKLAAYLFGTVNCVLYAIVAYRQTLYGETWLNLLYYLPLQAVGFCLWRRQMDGEKKTVLPRQMGIKGRMVLFGSVLLFTWILGIVLQKFGDALPFIDAFTTVASVVAVTLSAQRFCEQWVLWMAVNALSIYMWWERYCLNGENIATLFMWLIFLITAFYGFFNWCRA